MDIEIMADRATLLLIRQGDRFAIVERRNGFVYNCHGGKRDDLPLDQMAAIDSILDPADWMDETTARAAFEDAADRGTQTRPNNTLTSTGSSSTERRDRRNEIGHKTRGNGHGREGF